MDEFFQKLREIQKKERNLSGLAPVGENFYNDLSRYFNGLMRKIDNNPFSFESYLLRDAQRITAEICERREHKISGSALMNVQRSYQLFKESKSNSPDKVMKVPRNSTPEEELLYQALVTSLVEYREKMRGPLRFYISQNLNSEKTNPEKSNVNIEAIKDDLSNLKGSISGLEDEEDQRKDLDNLLAEELSIEKDIYKKFGQEPSSENIPSDEAIIKNSPKENREIDRNTKSLNDNQKLKNTDNTNNKIDTYPKIPTEVLMVLDELPSIMGVDKNVYGPFSPQDVITIPQPNARILIKNQKGRSIQRYK